MLRDIVANIFTQLAAHPFLSVLTSTAAQLVRVMPYHADTDLRNEDMIHGKIALVRVPSPGDWRPSNQSSSLLPGKMRTVFDHSSGCREIAEVLLFL